MFENIEEFCREMVAAKNEAKQAEMKMIALSKKMTCIHGRENYLFLEPFIKKASKYNFIKWSSPGFKTIYIEKWITLNEEAVMYSLIFFNSDGEKCPWIRFIVDDDRKMLIPTYYQNDEIYYYNHVFPTEDSYKPGILYLADDTLWNQLVFMKEWCIRPEDMEGC